MLINSIPPVVGVWDTGAVKNIHNQQSLFELFSTIERDSHIILGVNYCGIMVGITISGC